MDINELKAKIKDIESKNKRGGGSKAIWRPTGDHVVRILQLPGEADIGIEVRYHFNIGGEFKLYCPQNRGEDCEVCEADARLRAWKDESGRDKPELLRKAQFKVARDIEAGSKYFIPMIERGKDKDTYTGPLWWEVSAASREKLLRICANDDWNDGHPEGGALRVLTSYEQGLDINVSFKKAGERGNTKTFNVTDIEERKRFSPVFAKNNEVAAELMAQIPELDDTVLKVKTAKEVSRIFNGWFQEPVEGDTGEGIQRASNNAEGASGGGGVEDTVAKLKSLMDKKKAEQAEKSA